mmetsp:Transcript_33625/g.52320  ORF Transcript_33625/g.52320 Transcript_33625/m.52320 type:complete len:85 (+) Transcript_33625:939-1193(+)
MNRRDITLEWRGRRQGSQCNVLYPKDEMTPHRFFFHLQRTMQAAAKNLKARSVWKGSHASRFGPKCVKSEKSHREHATVAPEGE